MYLIVWRRPSDASLQPSVEFDLSEIDKFPDPIPKLIDHAKALVKPPYSLVANLGIWTYNPNFVYVTVQPEDKSKEFDDTETFLVWIRAEKVNDHYRLLNRSEIIQSYFDNMETVIDLHETLFENCARNMLFRLPLHGLEIHVRQGNEFREILNQEYLGRQLLLRRGGFYSQPLKNDPLVYFHPLDEKERVFEIPVPKRNV
ncbi:MAG: hypothetical protein V1740_08330 [Candidatus Woesearchaeota archaeon]